MRRTSGIVPPTAPRRDRRRREANVEFPDLRYTKKHEWARADGGSASAYRLRPDALGMWSTSTAGGEAEVTASQALVRWNPRVDVRCLQPAQWHDRRAQPLDERPELVNEQPYGDGWLIVFESPTRRSSSNCWMPRRIGHSSTGLSALHRDFNPVSEVEPTLWPGQGGPCG
jgi:hypothetical protein